MCDSTESLKERSGVKENSSSRMQDALVHLDRRLPGCRLLQRGSEVESTHLPLQQRRAPREGGGTH